jgi:hypothetical protein
MSASRRVLGALSGALAVACADAPDFPIASSGEAVSGGEVSGAADDFVVRVASRQPEPYDGIVCSGTLLAPNLLLTALHCVAVFDAWSGFTCLSDGSLAHGSAGGWIGETLAPADIEVSVGTALPLAVAARGASVFGSGSTVVCVDDIALVVLDTDLPVPGVPVRLERPVVEGERMTVIGYGLNDGRDVLRARRSGVPVLDVGPDDTSSGPGTAAPRTFIVGDGPCSGDNGGPSLSDETGAVTGVFAFGFSGDCTQPGTRGSFTKLAPFQSLLERAFQAAGRDPEVEGEELAAAAPMGSDTSCSVGRAGGGQAPLPLSLWVVVGVLLARRGAARPTGTCSSRRG